MVLFDSSVREYLSVKGAFEQGPESSYGRSHVDIWRKIIPAQRNSFGKLGVGLRNSKEANVAGAGWVREE